MVNNRNSSRRPINSRNMRNMVPQMSDCSNLNIENMPIAIAYVPFQQWQNIYEPRQALQRGTIFKELDLPFTCAKECK